MGRHRIPEVLTGALVLIVAIGFLAYAVAHSGRSTGSGYPLQARFDHIDGLSVGGDVRVAGVKVGSVTGVRVDPKTFSAIVTLAVRDDIKLPKDSSAEIDSESLLGGKYVALSPGGDETDLQPGQTIQITQGSISLEQLLGKFIFSMTSKSPSQSPGGQSSGGQSSGGQGNEGGGSGSQGSGSGGSGALAPLK